MIRPRLEPHATPLRRARLLRGMSTADLAREAGLGRTAIIRIEKSGRADEESMWRIAAALRVRREWVDERYAQHLADQAARLP